MKDVRYWSAASRSVSLAQIATRSARSFPTACKTISSTLCGCAELHTMTSSHARVPGAKRYLRNAGKYGRGITRRGAGPRCGWPRAERGGRGERRRRVPFRSSTRSLEVGEESVVEGVSERARKEEEEVVS